MPEECAAEASLAVLCRCAQGRFDAPTRTGSPAVGHERAALPDWQGLQAACWADAQASARC